MNFRKVQIESASLCLSFSSNYVRSLCREYEYSAKMFFYLFVCVSLRISNRMLERYSKMKKVNLCLLYMLARSSPRVDSIAVDSILSSPRILAATANR